MNLLEAVARISSGQRLSSSDEQLALEELESNECWQPLFRYLDQALAAGGPNLLGHYCRLIRLRLNYFNDIPAAQALTADLIRRCQIDFPTLHDVLLNDHALPDLEAQHEAALLDAASGAFSATAERVQALEKLAAVYEKRLFNEESLQQVFERLIQLDPNNIKALRYFKLAFSQAHDWEQVARVLKRLTDVVQTRQEKFRLAHDLAYCLVYHLNKPRDAILVLDRHCRESPLDVSQIEYDAAHRMGDIDRCIQVLQSALQSVRDDAGKAIVQFRMADLFRKSGKTRESEKMLQESLATWQVFLDPFEPLIQMQIASNSWAQVATTLQSLSLRVQDKELADQIQQAVRRIEAGLADRSQ